MTGYSPQEDCGSKTGRQLVAGSLVGLRSWRLDHNGQLRGITFPAGWKAGENEARCFAAIAPPGSYGFGSSWLFAGDEVTIAPGWQAEPCSLVERDCACGFYAYHDNLVVAYGGVTISGGPRVTGVIEGYGRVIVGPSGFRASKARIVALTVPVLGHGFGDLMTRSQLTVLTALHAGMADHYRESARKARRLPLGLFRRSKARQLQARADLERQGSEHARAELQLLQTPSSVRWERCLERYPGVEIFDDVASMRTAHPSPDVSVLLEESG
jgi:hypothetical protein